VIKLIFPENTLEKLEPSQRDELAVLAALVHAEIYCPKKSPVVDNGETSLPLVLEIGNVNTSLRWAANDHDALAPTPFWGGNAKGAQFVRVVNGIPLASLPAKWMQRSPSDLRVKEEDTLTVSITSELDGLKQNFGRNVWELLVNRAPILKRKLSGKQPLVSIQYNDRYLHSPLTLLLLKEFLGGLDAYQGGANSATNISIVTSNLPRNDLHQPRFIHHNWRDTDHRRQAFMAMFTSIGEFTFIDDKNNIALPHARELLLKWHDGSGYSIRLDQGVGYWRTAKGMKPFPFDQAPERQTKYLDELLLEIEASNQSFPTYWYLSEQK